MTSVVEQARSIIGRFSRRHQNHVFLALAGKRDCGNQNGRLDAGIFQASASNYAEVGGKFGKYYREKIANLERSDFGSGP